LRDVEVPGAAPVADNECASKFCYLTHGGSKICAPSSSCGVYGSLCVLNITICCGGANVCNGILGGLTCSQ